MTTRAPHLHDSLRNFCLGAFRYLHLEVDAGAELPFAFEQHASPGRPPLYEYHPLVRGYVEERARALSTRDDVRLALDDLRREPAAAIFSRAHAGPRPSEDEALFHSVLLPLIVSTAEACGGFDWKDDAFARAYAELEASLFRGRHAYAAIAPLIGLSTGGQIDLGDGIRVRVAASGELASAWPEANGLLPADFGRERSIETGHRLTGHHAVAHRASQLGLTPGPGKLHEVTAEIKASSRDARISPP